MPVGQVCYLFETTHTDLRSLARVRPQFSIIQPRERSTNKLDSDSLDTYTDNIYKYSTYIRIIRTYVRLSTYVHIRKYLIYILWHDIISYH